VFSTHPKSVTLIFVTKKLRKPSFQRATVWSILAAWAITMTFIEALFGFSPDANSGATETAIFVALSAVLVILLRLYLLRRRPKT
jgi:drug/metabolite transporter (DMT)-like permease